METNTVHLGDCLELMKDVADKSVDMILCDLPYGTTACKWDVIIPFEPLWAQYKRIIKDNGAIVLTASQPFTSKLVMSNLEMFRYEWIWEKNNFTSFMHVNYMPLKSHENIIIFSKGRIAHGTSTPIQYHAQDIKILEKPIKHTTRKIHALLRCKTTGNGEQVFTNYPKSIIKIKSEKKRVHPTQKPVALFEYLIRTYTNDGELVLDNCAGSGTTAIACINTNRNYILIEKEEKYFEIIKKRIQDHTNGRLL